MSEPAESPRYLSQHTPQTLAEGLIEYNRVYAQTLSNRTMSAEAQLFFTNHDIAHVVFGCNLSLAQEAVVKIYSLFGTTAGVGVLAQYALPEAKEIYQKLSLNDILATFLSAALLVPWTLYRCARMQKRWPWDDHKDLQHLPLAVLRERYGIKVPGSG